MFEVAHVIEREPAGERLLLGGETDRIGLERQEFALRTSGCRVSLLRLGYRVSEGTTLGAYLSLPIVPTFAGYDPRLQLLHEDDAAEAVFQEAFRTDMTRWPSDRK